jgi:hypothetical protein
MRLSASTTVVIVSLLIPATITPAQDRIEISDDARITITIRDGESTSGASFARGSNVPYALEPDWQNDLRRQVGGLQVADMNGDGWNDVVVGCYKSQSFPPYEHWFTYIYYNTGGELEADPSWISDDEVSTADVQVGDIDLDGYPDIFAANGGFEMSDSVIYFGGPDGPDTTPDWSSNEPNNAFTIGSLLLDVDHDGDLDVITGNQGNSQSDPYRPMFMFFNNDGDLSTVPGWQSAESSIQSILAAADYDGDGWEDVAVSKWVNFESAIYKNMNGALQTVPVWTTGDDDSDKGVAWADVDGNGWPDLALGHDPTLLYSNDDGTLTNTWSSEDTFFGQQDMRFADVDQDGDDDLAEIHFSNGHVNIYINNDGVLDSLPTWTYDSPHTGTAIAFGDINGDERIDLVVGNSGDHSLMVFYGIELCPADLNGDETVDVFDLLELLGSWGPCPPPCSPDVNGDGTVDVFDLLELLGAWGPC